MGCKLDEREQRLFAANEVQAAGHGALTIVHVESRQAMRADLSPRKIVNRAITILDQAAELVEPDVT